MRIILLGRNPEPRGVCQANQVSVAAVMELDGGIATHYARDASRTLRMVENKVYSRALRPDQAIGEQRVPPQSRPPFGVRIPVSEQRRKSDLAAYRLLKP